MKRRRTGYWNCGEESGLRRTMIMVENMQKGRGDEFPCKHNLTAALVSL